MVAGIVAAHGVDGLFMITVMAGVLLVIMGVTGLGFGVKFIPRPVVIGFTNGIAVLIASTQIKDFFGLHLDKVPGVFSLRIEALARNFHTLSYQATALAVVHAADVDCLPQRFCPHPRTHRCVASRNAGCLLFQAAGGNNWHALWRNTKRLAAFRHPQVPDRPHSRPAWPRLYRSHAGRDRITHVRGRVRPHEQ